MPLPPRHLPLHLPLLGSWIEARASGRARITPAGRAGRSQSRGRAPTAAAAAASPTQRRLHRYLRLRLHRCLAPQRSPRGHGAAEGNQPPHRHQQWLQQLPCRPLVLEAAMAALRDAPRSARILAARLPRSRFGRQQAQQRRRRQLRPFPVPPLQAHSRRDPRHNTIEVALGWSAMIHNSTTTTTMVSIFFIFSFQCRGSRAHLALFKLKHFISILSLP